MELALVSLTFLCSCVFSFTSLWSANRTLPSVLPNHQSVWGLMTIEGRSVCHSVAVASALLLSTYMEPWDFSLPTVPVLHLLLWCAIHAPCIVHPRDTTRLCFVVVLYKVLTVSMLLFEFCVLWERRCTVDPSKKARVFMQRKVLVLVVSIWTRFWPKASPVLKSCEHASVVTIDAARQ